MKFKIKKTYSIFDSKIKIKFVSDQPFAGLYDHSKKTIYINENQSEKEIFETFLHEIFHCIQYHTGINQAVSHELLEVMAETQASAICKILNAK